MNFSIEVAVSDNTTKTEKGRLLERLGRDLLLSSHYEVTEEVRLTGMEVDLLAKHRITSEEIYIECKAYRDTLSADIITKLIGNITINAVSSGWLITTGELGKDAKGLLSTWELKQADVRRKLQVYTPQRLLEALMVSRCIKDPLTIEGAKEAENVCLLITNYGRFWAVPQIHVSAGVPYSVILFDAFTGGRVTNNDLIEDVSKCDSSFRELDWVMGPDIDSISRISELIEESQSVVNVLSGDQWSDYRPSRPQDFVGRQNLQQEVFKFLDSVRLGITLTRVIALKAPSGWGKSSFLLKLSDKADNIRNRGKYFIYSVDVRAATSHRYSDFSLISCLKAAIQAGFISGKDTPILSGSVSPFNDKSLIQIFNQLKEEQKVIVLMFDQFEEIFSKKELALFFDNIKRLCSAVDSIQENFILGFAWKTDGAVPTEHPAYHMWHALSDRRLEFTLPPFSGRDTSNALRIFSNELGVPLNPILKKHLIDHSQGYPWLLKKLCIHVHSLIKDGIEQKEVLGKGLNIGQLFERDLNEISAPEIACVRRIAAESPADFFQTAEIFGTEVVQSLQDRRLVIRRGHRLTLYWDIFRDYVHTGKVPQIPISYLPQATFRRYYNSVTLLINSIYVDSGDISNSLGIGKGAADNLIRDMVMVGNAERVEDKVQILQKNESAVLSRVIDFLRNHIVYKSLVEDKGPAFLISIDEFRQHVRTVYSSSSIGERTLTNYAGTILSWFRGVGMIDVKASNVVMVFESTSRIIPSLNLLRMRRRQLSHFLGDAPAHRVLDVMRLIQQGANHEETLIKKGYRNAISVLFSLEALEKENGELKLIQKIEENSEWLSEKVSTTETIKFVLSIIESSVWRPTAIDIGRSVANYLNKNWSESSSKRYGGALLSWIQWINEGRALTLF